MVNKCSSVISSTSDDRSIVIWNVKPFSEHQNTYDHWKYANIIPNYSLYAHKARVWKSIVMESGNILSAGEVKIKIIFINHTRLFFNLNLNNIKI